MRKNKRAFFISTSPAFPFAAGNVALSLYKYMPNESYDLIIYYKDLLESDLKVLESIPNTILVPFAFPKSFVKDMIKMVPSDSRFSTEYQLMVYTRFEIFKLLEEYEVVCNLDIDISIQGNLMEIFNFKPLGISLDIPWRVGDNFSQPVSGYNMELPGYCSAVIVANNKLPYKKMYDWCYEKSVEYASSLLNADQAIINLLLQEFQIKPEVMPFETWQCICWREQSNIAKIVHFGTDNKVWNTENIFNSFPGWYRVHQEWLKIGGSNFNQEKIRTFSLVNSLNDYDKLRTEHDKLRTEHDKLRTEHDKLRKNVIVKIVNKLINK